MASNATFNGVEIGCHAWISTHTGNEVEVHKIPRADGVIIRRRGGGLKTITVTAWKVFDTRAELEQYFDSLGGSFTSAIADLIVNGVTYSNCILQSINPGTAHNNFMTYTVTFLKSGD